jgi:hypothetical protein
MSTSGRWGFNRSSWRLGSAWAGVLAAAVTAAAAQPPAAPTVPAPAAPAAANPMDPAMRLLAEATQSFQGVRDYTCLFIKRERLRGQLQPDNLIDMKVRSQPFSVYLRWLGPKQFEGQEACYVVGRNNNMMRVHSAGIGSMAGFLTIDIRDPRVMQNSRHTITEAGIGNLLTVLSQRWEADRRSNRTQVKIAEYAYAQRPCTRVELIHGDRPPGQITFFRCVLYFDKGNHLPIRVENYDWPRPGGPPDGDLLESYSYVNLRTNVGLTDAVFNH